MNDKDWEKFFELISKIVNTDNMSATDKTELVWQKAFEQDATGDLDEFMCYSNPE